jgi:two-component system NarL family sensor kinase
LALELDLDYGRRHPREQLVFSAARELLANVVRHAEASTLELRLAGENGKLELVVADDGCGFALAELPERLAEGHVGLATQRVRVEAAGGMLVIASAPGAGTRVEVTVPDKE